MAKNKGKSKYKGRGEEANDKDTTIAAAKQSALKRTLKKSQHNHVASKTSITYRQFLVLFLTTASILGLLLCIAPFFFLPPGIDDAGNVQNHVTNDVFTESASSDADHESWNQTREFLDTFVCHYKPSSTLPLIGVEKGGYCHPNLVAIPAERTQRISRKLLSTSNAKHGLSSSSLYARLSEELSFRWGILSDWWLAITQDDAIGQHTTGIPPRKLIMRLPRPLQVWDLDALRDRFIQSEFLGISDFDNGTVSNRVARHKDTQNALDSGAFLAVHLLRLLHEAQISNDDPDDKCQADGDNGECRGNSDLINPRWRTLDQQQQDRSKLLLPYLKILPTYFDRVAKARPPHPLNPHDHPLTWDQSTLKSLFPEYTHTYDLIQHYRQMIQSEYEALKLKSPNEFSNNVEFTDYLAMRINVLSRAFGVSASDNESGAQWSAINTPKDQFSLKTEMRSYITSNFGVSLDDSRQSEDVKLRSMCPLLDMYNSHPNPNASWRYDSRTSSYVVHSKGIKQGYPVVVSYGKYTEGHLFAKYGYVNGDGSSPTEVNLAVFHRILGDVGLGQQYSQVPIGWFARDHKRFLEGVDNTDMSGTIHAAVKATQIQRELLLRYLVFDDGYEDCVEAGGTDWELKLLKFQHLLRLANSREDWIVRLPAKHPDARPGPNLLAINSEGDIENAVGIDAKRILSICRLLSLTADDLDGNAIEFLSGKLNTTLKPIKLKRHGDALEYRAMMCVARLSTAGLNPYEVFAKKHGIEEPNQFGSREWTAWYIRKGEVRVLQILRRTAMQQMEELKKPSGSSKGFIVRETGACPVEKSTPLLDQL
mmetsp:Transcript_15992/g.32542  ORF Transcript_15992/g.32542 Transcript_15992/m.32542 type:complete len:821 (-) Transcript_15992:58-2520(-)